MATDMKWLGDALEKLSPEEWESLGYKVGNEYKQGFKVTEVTRNGKSAVVAVELEDGKAKTIRL